MTKIIGCIMLATPFIYLFIDSCFRIGIQETILFFLGLMAIGLWIFIAIILILWKQIMRES